MKIIDRIQAIHEFIKNDPAGTGLATDLQKLATKAILDGKTSADWRAYMCYFASNPDQLQRLTGQDTRFNGTIYGLNSLAYMVANSMCGAGTVTETGRNMTKEMRDGLDRDLRSDDDSENMSECSEQHKMFKQYFS